MFGNILCLEVLTFLQYILYVYCAQPADLFICIKYPENKSQYAVYIIVQCIGHFIPQCNVLDLTVHFIKHFCSENIFYFILFHCLFYSLFYFFICVILLYHVIFFSFIVPFVFYFLFIFIFISYLISFVPSILFYFLT